jgi:N-acetylglutamate synthase-like GNAT family acetyltransferase
MSDFGFSVVRTEDSSKDADEVRSLLAADQLELDAHIELFVLCREHGRLIACAGLDHNVIKCVAVEHGHRGESLSLRLGTEIVRQAAARKRFHLFLYSAPHNEEFFRGWGFYPLVEVQSLVTVMENSPIAIKTYCENLRQQKKPGSRIGWGLAKHFIRSSVWTQESMKIFRDPKPFGDCQMTLNSPSVRKVQSTNEFWRLKTKKSRDREGRKWVAQILMQIANSLLQLK